MGSTTYFWMAVVILIAAVLIAGVEKYRAQHLRASRHHASSSLDQPTSPRGRATGRIAIRQPFHDLMPHHY
jgi:hypothetical protein